MDRNITIRYEIWYESTNQIRAERNWMDLNMKILLWKIMGDDESDWDGLGQNVS